MTQREYVSQAPEILAARKKRKEQQEVASKAKKPQDPKDLVPASKGGKRVMLPSRQVQHTVYKNIGVLLAEREWTTGFQDPDYTPPKTKPTGTTKKELDAARKDIPKKVKDEAKATVAARKKKG